MQSLAVDAPLAGHLGDRTTITNHSQDRLVPLLSHAHLLHGRQCYQSAELGVTNQPKARGASAEDLLGCFSRTSTDSWWAAVDSNHLPPRYQHGALPVELAAHGLGKGLPAANRANRNSTMARIRARKQRQPGGRSAVRLRPTPYRLHRRDSFVDRDL